MKRELKKVAAAAFGVIAASAWADVKLASPFSDGAVFQRERPVPIWGKASPGEKVKVSFAGQTKAATASADGKWLVTLDPMPASFESRTLTVTSTSQTSQTSQTFLSDILVGEVWFASGQSNMKCPIDGPSPRFRDGQGRMAIAMTREPNVRFFKVMNGKSEKPLDETPFGWYRFTAEDCAKIVGRPALSAVAYYYALEVYHAAKVPVGVIESSIGGVSIESWTPRSGLLSRPDLKDIADYKVRTEKEWTASRDTLGAINGHGQQPGVYWNAMVAPFVPYAIRGLIWYQGCHNAGDSARYCSQMHALYNGWATEFRNPDLELYFVELAPYKVSWFDIQQQQRRFADEQKHAAIVNTCDVGNPNDIHHNEKRTVARRLAMHALKRLYGFPEIEDESPRPKAATAKGGTVTLTFDHVKKLYFYNIPRTRPEGFELAGADGKWHPAEVTNAESDKTSTGGIYYPGLLLRNANYLTLASAAVPKPVKLRYLHEAPWTGCLYNEVDLPLGSFQMDVVDLK